MKYMLIMRDNDEAAALSRDADFDEMIRVMGAYNDALTAAGVLVGVQGLEDPAQGFIVDFSHEPPMVTDGPYGETHELFNGYWIIDVSSREEAAQWASRAPLGRGSKMEVRRIPSIEEAFGDHLDAQQLATAAERPADSN